MAMRREAGAQDDLVATWAEIPRSPGHAFYDRLQTLLKEAGFDVFVEDICKPYYAARMGAPSAPPGRYFACTWSATSKGSTANAALSGAARIRCRCGTSCGFLNREKVPVNPRLSNTSCGSHPPPRRWRHHDPRADAGRGAEEPFGGGPRPNTGRSLRPGRRQGLSLTRDLEGS